MTQRHSHGASKGCPRGLTTILKSTSTTIFNFQVQPPPALGAQAARQTRGGRRLG